MNHGSDRKEGGTYWLVGVEGKACKVRLPINAALLVGRGASNHIILDDPRISRQHARFAPEPGGPILYDLNSANGTLVNGVAVSRHRLQPGDVIRFGRYVFRIDEIPPNEATSASKYELEARTFVATDSLSALPLTRDSAGSGERHLVDLTQLEDAYQKLGTLYSFMQAIGTTIDRGELLRLIGGKMREVYSQARSVAIYLCNRSARRADAFDLAHFSGAGTLSDAPSLPEDVTSSVLDTARAILVGGAPESTRAPRATEMFAPMIDRGDVLGVIHVSADRPSFLPNDLELLNGMAAAAAMMLQNSRMHDESLLRDRLKYDLELAARIQKSFLPREVISVEGLELLAEYRAAYKVGGDFYDVFWVGEDKLAVFIGDISGKGVAAALLMARISSELRVAALAHIEPVAVLSAMNEAIVNCGQPELFFTTIYFTFDVKTGEIVLANAGHPTPYCCRSNGSIEPITDGASSAVGILQAPGFAATRLRLGHGDSLVLYTDGVVEAANAHGGLYGSARLEACLEAIRSTRPNEIAEHILRSVEEHARDTAVSDDLTLFICHRAVGRPASLQPRRRSDSFVALNASDIEERA
jgi:serine phosphatase RsbU (regulator of sigma subunit)/pSer/pThr/pTyr-binding forkhead associated (FHA) protein